MYNADFDMESVNKKISQKLPQIQANIDLFWRKAFDIGISRLIYNSFFAIKIKNLEYYTSRDTSKSNIIIANHNNWWDGMTAYYLCRKIFKTNIHMMIEELHRFPLLSKIGAFSVEKNSPFNSYRALNYASKLLENPENSLWIYPQGKVLPPDYRPLEMKNGVSYLCKKVKTVNIIPIAVKYTFLREDRPEILIEIGCPIVLEDDSKCRKELTSYLEHEFQGLLNRQSDDISKGSLSGYKTVFKGKANLIKKFEKHFSFIVRSRIF